MNLKKLLPVVAVVHLAAAWLQGGYGPGNTGYNPDESQLNLGTVNDLRLRWTVTPAPGEAGCETTPEPPLVAGERVIMFEDGGISAHDARTGERLWLRKGFSVLGKTLAIADGLVLATDTSCHSQSNYEGTVTALRLDTGVPVWESRQSGMVDQLVADSGVLVTHGYCYLCDEDRNQVVAYRLTDGSKLWTRNSAELVGEVSAGGRVLLSGNGTEAVQIRTGAVSWRSALAWRALSSSPSGDRILATIGYRFSSLDAQTGQIAWSVRSTVESLSSDGRRVYAAGTALTAYDAGHGGKLWSRALTGPGKPVRAGGLLYVTHGGPALAILSPATGKPAAPGGEYRTATGHVVVAGGRLFTTDGTAIRAYAG